MNYTVKVFLNVDILNNRNQVLCSDLFKDIKEYVYAKAPTRSEFDTKIIRDFFEELKADYKETLQRFNAHMVITQSRVVLLNCSKDAFSSEE